MENYSYNSYPESGGSSPRSREIDFENPPPWEDNQSAGNINYKVKLMASYGGKIHPRPHDNQLAYIGGETKILAVDRSIKFSVLVAKLSALCDADVCFKYQLPGEDLDALISVTNDDDLDHMMIEYDRLHRASPKPARLRLFLFPSVQTPSLTPAHSFGSADGRSERERFVDALNSGSVSAPPSASPTLGNADFLFGSEKGVAPVAPMAVPKVRDLPIVDPDVAIVDDRIGIGADPIQKHIQDLRRLQIAEEQQQRQQQQQTVYRRQSDDNIATGGYTGDYYVPRTLTTDRVVSTTLPVGSIPLPAPGYHISGGFPTASTISGDQQPVYMVPAQSSMYHAPMPRPVTGPIGHGQGQGQGQGHGYYAVQRMPTEVYRDQPLYNPMQQSIQSVPTQQQPNKIGTHPEGVRMVQSTAGMADYAQVAYENGVGRHVYYAPQGTMVTPQPQPQPQPQLQPQQTTVQHYHHAMGVVPQQAGLNQGGGKAVGPVKISQGSI